MSIKRIMGTETEYGITGGEAFSVVAAYRNGKKKHENLGSTNESVVSGLTDVGGHIGGDYGTLSEQYEMTYGTNPVSHFDEMPWLHSTGRFMGARRIYGGSGRVEFPQFSSGDDSIISNGSRFYVDMGHPEMSIAETSNPRDLVIWDKAGESIVGSSAAKIGKDIHIYKNNSDGKGHSYGCHENYLLKRFSGKEFEEVLVPAILPFFVTRQIFAGNGKVGIEEEANDFPGYYMYGSWKGGNHENPMDSYKRNFEKAMEAIDKLGRHYLDTPEFSDVEKLLRQLNSKRSANGEQVVYQLSQRADFFQRMIGLGTTSDRPIINTRDEPHADSSKYMRLHVICGDANLSEVSNYLKTGTTALVLDLIEDGVAPRLELENPVRSIQRISLDQSRKWTVPLTDGKTISAVDIQRAYLEAATARYKGRDAVTDDVLLRWGNTLDALETDPMKLSSSIDWVIKLNLLSQFAQAKGLSFNDDFMKTIALQYHDIDRNKGLFYHLQNKGLVERIVTDEEIEHAVKNPPSDTRAYLRGRATSIDDVSNVDWGGFDIKTKSGRRSVKLNEPFSGNEEQTKELLDNYNIAGNFADALKRIPGIKVSRESIFRGFGKKGRRKKL